MPERAAYKKQDKSHWPDFKHKAKSTRENKKITNRMTRRKKKQEVQEEMADQEKVIKKLEECLSASCRGFRTCPYNDDNWDAVGEALTVLKEQEPVKPTVTVDTRDGWRWYRCGKCGNLLASGVGERAVRLFGTSKYPVYCEMCGRKVDWND